MKQKIMKLMILRRQNLVHAMLINNDEVGINIFGSGVNNWNFKRMFFDGGRV